MIEDDQANSSLHQPFGRTETQLVSQDAATCLRKSTNQIVTVWRSLVQRHDPCATVAFLGDCLPLVLHGLADALEDPNWRFDAERANSVAHGYSGRCRQTDTHTIGQVIGEYAILRHAICERMGDSCVWPPQVTARIHAFIDNAICMAADDFAGLRQPSEIGAVRRLRDGAEGDFVSREDVAALLEEKQARERVVAMLSHDLRSPLSTILISAECLARKPGDEKLASSLAPRLIRSANRIDRMIQDMLDASRLRAGRGVSLTSMVCDLAQIAAEAHEEYVLVHGRRVKLRSPKSVSGVWDADAVRRVMDNLVGNAFKYGAHDTDVIIEVTDTPQRIRLAVHNQGNPLTEEEIAVLFDPYVRTKSAENSAQRGWGLGLTLVQGVAKAHGGEVGARSSPETGTTFWFELPKAGYFTTHEAQLAKNNPSEPISTLLS